MKSNRTWKEKIEQPEGKIVPMPPTWVRRYGEGQLLIPRPLDVDALIRKTPKGRLITQGQIRTVLAKRHKVQAACPITTGIFVWMISEKAVEDLKAGKQRVTPYWRVVRDDGGLNPKFPGGAGVQAARLRAEGHAVEASRGKKAPKVLDFERRLVKLSS